jgi:hypothetical protein
MRAVKPLLPINLRRETARQVRTSISDVYARGKSSSERRSNERGRGFGCGLVCLAIASRTASSFFANRLAW